MRQGNVAQYAYKLRFSPRWRRDVLAHNAQHPVHDVRRDIRRALGDAQRCLQQSLESLARGTHHLGKRLRRGIEHRKYTLHGQLQRAQKQCLVRRAHGVDRHASNVEAG